MKWWPIATCFQLAAAGSCEGKCGYWDDDCWCNEACGGHGNCCPDYEEKCGCQRCGKYTCDEWIAWDSSYTCEELSKKWGCDCKGCHCATETSATLTLFNSSFPEAKCLDGSKAGFYLRKGSAQHILIFLEGGGWCYDPSCSALPEATLQDCQRRSQQRLGSSKSWPLIRKESRGMHLGIILWHLLGAQDRLRPASEPRLPQLDLDLRALLPPGHLRDLESPVPR